MRSEWDPHSDVAIGTEEKTVGENSGWVSGEVGTEDNVIYGLDHGEDGDGFSDMGWKGTLAKVICFVLNSHSSFVDKAQYFFFGGKKDLQARIVFCSAQ